VNFIAAAWIQFMVHDWVDHGPNPSANPIKVPLPSGDALGYGLPGCAPHQSPTRRARRPTPARSTPTATTTPTGGTAHNCTAAARLASDKVRSFVDGKLKINADGTLPAELLSGKPVTGCERELVGRACPCCTKLFTKEHNAIASMLKQKYPTAKSDQWLYDHARLVNAALMAKIHTVEWTPGRDRQPGDRARHVRQLVGTARRRLRYA
jgi:hypothetical protein